jgi:hypothetical protein
MGSDRDGRLELLRLMAARLERLSVDSHWARRASGLRGNIIKVLEGTETTNEVTDSRLDLLTEAAFELLRRAARELPDVEAFLKQFHREATDN